MKKKVIITIVIVVLVLSGIIGKYAFEKAQQAHDNSVVEFKDETMGQVLCNSCHWSDEITLKNVTYKDLKGIKELKIGYVGYYDTLVDLQYCTRLDDLYINGGIGEHDGAYFINQGEVNRKVSEKDVENIQQELGEVLPKLKELTQLEISSEGKVKWTSIDFLKDCDNIEEFWINNCKGVDYSVLKTCTSLKEIQITCSDISKAEDIIGLENLESIMVLNTPLAENPEEVKKLQEAYPDAEIYY